MAEKIYQDISGKKVIAGTFNAWTLMKKEPQEKTSDGTKLLVRGGTDPGSPAVYISLTDVVDETEITLQFHNVSRNKVLFESPAIRIPCKSRLATIEIIAPLPPLQGFIEAGIFSLDIVWKGEILGSHRITATLASPESE